MVSCLVWSPPMWLLFTAVLRHVSSSNSQICLPCELFVKRHKSKHQACEKPRLHCSPVIPFFLETCLILKLSPPLWFPPRGVVPLLGPFPSVVKAQGLRGSPLQMMMAAGSHTAGDLDSRVLMCHKRCYEGEKRLWYLILNTHTHTTHTCTHTQEMEIKKVKESTKTQALQNQN